MSRIAHHYTPSQIALYEAAKARAMRRVIAARAIAKPTSNVSLVVIPSPISALPKAPSIEVDHNHHVLAWNVWRGKYGGQKVRRYIFERCEELGIDAGKLFSPCREHEITRARQIIMWEIKTYVKPAITLPEIGKIFDRDHTTVLHALHKVSAEMGVEYVRLKKSEVADGG